MPDFSHASRFWNDVDVIIGNALSVTVASSQFFHGYFNQEPPVVGDTMEFNVSLDPGDYTLKTFGVDTPDSGIQDVFINGILVAQLDRYAGGTVFNSMQTQDVTITQQTNTVRSEVNTQNGSSAGFNLVLSRIFFVPR